MGSRRKFIKNIGLHSAALTMLPIIPLDWRTKEKISVPYIPESGEDEDFWAKIQESYTSSKSLINLNNGGVSPQPKFVQEAFSLYNSMSNEGPSYQMWRILEPGRVNIRKDLGNLLGCSVDEVVINRNTTEALGTVIFGLNLKKGDEVVLTHYDYPNMRNAWEQRKVRDGVVLNYADILLPDHSEEEIVARFVEKVSSKTRLVHITHMVNYNGQILPVKEIIKAVKQKNSDVLIMVDGAHTFAHVPFNLKEIDCDFFGTSLHKWLCAPFGSGLMYIKKERIAEVWATYPTDATALDDIRKFEALGTRSVPTEIAVGQAILFHKNIGIERKYNRLKALTDYWTSEFEDEERLIKYNNKKDGTYASLFTFGIDGMKGPEISKVLQKKFQVVSSPISWQNIEGCRISPHIYTTHSDLDKLIDGIQTILSQ